MIDAGLCFRGFERSASDNVRDRCVVSTDTERRYRWHHLEGAGTRYNCCDLGSYRGAARSGLAFPCSLRRGANLDGFHRPLGLGRFEGREAIRGFFRGASGIFSFAIHYSLNGHIEVEGDQARARWYLFMPCTAAAGNQAMWRAGIDHETYARVDGAWMFRRKRSEPLMSVPFETGWAKTRFA
jgi:hypothetical protein